MVTSGIMDMAVASLTPSKLVTLNVFLFRAGKRCTLIKCLQINGSLSSLISLLFLHSCDVIFSTYIIHDLVEETKGRSIMLDRAENLLHDRFGDTEYWGVR